MMKRAGIKLLGLLLTSLISFTACEKGREIVKGEHHGVEAESASNGEWLGFTPYPAARQLCNQYTLGSTNDNKPMEIHGVTFATRDAPEDVIAFYSKGESGNAEVEGKSITIRRGNPVESVLSAQAASAAHFHTCADQPRPEEKNRDRRVEYPQKVASPPA